MSLFQNLKSGFKVTLTYKLEKNTDLLAQTQIEMSKSYTSGTSQVPLLGTTIGDLFDQTVEKYANHEGLVVTHQNIRWTYKQLQQQVDDCAKALIAMNIKKGDRVGIWSPNRSEWLIIQLATAKIGAILVNINPSYRLNELEYALNQSGCCLPRNRLSI